MNIVTILATAAYLALFESVQGLSWTVRFRSYEKDSCYFVNIVDVTDSLSIYYNVHEAKPGEPANNVDYTVTGPNGQLLMSEASINYKDFKVQPSMLGEHSICFKHHGGATEKVIDIDVNLIKSEASKAAAAASQKELTSSAPTAEIERVNRRVKDDLSSLYHSLLNIKDREKANHSTVKSILKVVKWFSILQALTVVGLGFAHVYVLKTFFSNNAKTRV